MAPAPTLRATHVPCRGLGGLASARSRFRNPRRAHAPRGTIATYAIAPAPSGPRSSAAIGGLGASASTAATVASPARTLEKTRTIGPTTRHESKRVQGLRYWQKARRSFRMHEGEAPAGMAVYLKILQGVGQGQVLPVPNDQPVTIGRSSQASYAFE